VAENRIYRELAALLILSLTAFSALALASWYLGAPANWCGPLGERLSRDLTHALGASAWLALLFAAWVGARVWGRIPGLALARALAGGVLLLGSINLAAASAAEAAGGGVLGAGVQRLLTSTIGATGSYLAIAMGLIFGSALAAWRAPTDLAAGIVRKFFAPRAVPRPPASDGAAVPLTLRAPEEIVTVKGASGQTTARGPIELLTSLVWKHESPEAHGESPGRGELPPLSLLDTPPSEHTKVDEAAIERSARLLEQKLADFGVEGKVVEVQPGPVVTMYKFEPASGVKVSQIVNLADDLSMALKALAIRIQAPVPGEAVVGIEVPNRKREKVYLREILECAEFAAAQSQLTLALGKDIAGYPMVADLARMPHLLIAGATGTGKSVSIHTMIASVLFNATPDDVRFILIDPKMLELSVYENIPHLLVPVLVDPDKAAAALAWAVKEMERRYRVMRDMAVRNIDGYNQALAAGQKGLSARGQALPSLDDEDSGPIEHRRLPKIIIVIDELADLMLAEGKALERDITRLAQKARAAGIHLILATQRPSVDVLTGLIKANLPARISLQTASRVDSRTILDSIGAERLLGEGDMLFMPPGTAKLKRLHGPFVSEVEVRKVTDFLRAQGAPEFQFEILETASAEGEGEEGYEKDEMYDEAVRIVLESNQASISMIQRRLRVGYNRAARMVEQMEREGLVAPADGARPREVRGAGFAKHGS
jgi:DNA segregation ATPase FtsK/SpoIIIE-like protein